MVTWFVEHIVCPICAVVSWLRQMHRHVERLTGQPNTMKLCSGNIFQAGNVFKILLYNHYISRDSL